MEGHAGFAASIVKGDVRSAKLEIKEGVRLIEGVLIGRHFSDLPVIAQRICGICPVVHNLVSVKAIENAMRVEISQETIKLRKLLELGQIIHSHCLHLFFLSLADFLDIENDLVLVKEYPEEAKKAIRLREYGMEIVRVIGGRVIHPLTNEIGGFKKIPAYDEMQKIADKSEGAIQDALMLGDLFKSLKMPQFFRPTEYVSLNKTGEYAIYDGDIVSNKGLRIAAEDFEKNFRELQRQQEVIKRVKSDGKTSYMVGAIARVNLQREKLNPKAAEYLKQLGLEFPDFNPFHNILHQMAEVIHAIEESVRILSGFLLHRNLENALTKTYKTREGMAAAAVEAPRGTLYYHVDIDAKGYARSVNIITPTAQFLSHMEDDIASYLPQILDLSEKEKEKKLRAFIRAYDPCISCAVH